MCRCVLGNVLQFATNMVISCCCWLVVLSLLRCPSNRSTLIARMSTHDRDECFIRGRKKALMGSQPNISRFVSRNSEPIFQEQNAQNPRHIKSHRQSCPRARMRVYVAHKTRRSIVSVGTGESTRRMIFNVHNRL